MSFWLERCWGSTTLFLRCRALTPALLPFWASIGIRSISELIARATEFKAMAMDSPGNKIGPTEPLRTPVTFAVMLHGEHCTRQTCLHSSPILRGSRVADGNTEGGSRRGGR